MVKLYTMNIKAKINDFNHHYLSIENWNEYVSVASIKIPLFLKNFLKDVIPHEYHLKKGVNLSFIKQLSSYFHIDELAYGSNFRSLKKQVEWLSGRIAIKELLSKVAFPGRDPRDIVIEYDEKGKPVVRGEEKVGISISHSNGLAMAAVHRVPGKQLGFDLEGTEKIDTEAIISVICSENEKKELKDRSHDAIMRLFTLKEAFLKYIGTGFHETIKQVMVQGTKIFYRNNHIDDIVTECRFFDNYIASLIFEK